jgi:hypothetical protein
MPETTTNTPDLVSKLSPGALKGKIKEDTVVSRSRRPALGQVTAVTRLVAGGFRVTAQDGSDWGEYPKFAQALRVARYGPQEAEEASEEEASEGAKS